MRLIFNAVFGRVDPERKRCGDDGVDDGHQDEHGEDSGVEDTYDAKIRSDSGLCTGEGDQLTGSQTDVQDYTFLNQLQVRLST